MFDRIVSSFYFILPLVYSCNTYIAIYAFLHSSDVCFFL